MQLISKFTELKLPSAKTARAIGVNLALSLVLYYLGRYQAPAWTIFLALALEAYRLGRQPASDRVQLLVDESPLWLVTLSVAVLMSLSVRAVTQVVLALFLVIWRTWLQTGTVRPIMQLAVAGLTQFVGIWALFLAQSVWHWPTVIVLLGVWGLCLVVAHMVLASYEDPAVTVLAAAWGLVAAEAGWIFSIWQFNYILFNGYVILPQAAIVLTALGYCFGGIYVSHRRSQLSRGRLLEYLMIGLVMLAIVIAGTKWNGAI
jgi:hypothetical protein